MQPSTLIANTFPFHTLLFPAALHVRGTVRNSVFTYSVNICCNLQPSQGHLNDAVFHICFGHACTFCQSIPESTKWDWRMQWPTPSWRFWRPGQAWIMYVSIINCWKWVLEAMAGDGSCWLRHLGTSKIELPREVFEQVVTLLLPNSNNLALSFAYFDSLAVV